jgi:hypothetical protein
MKKLFEKSSPFTYSLFILFMSFFFHSFARAEGIVCETAFGEKKISLSDNKVAFEKPMAIERSISSIDQTDIRTEKKHKGFVKTLYLKGLKHRIRVKDSTQFNEAEDSLTITSPKGHEMTYPLSCHQA